MTKLNEAVRNALNNLQYFDWVTLFYCSKDSMDSALESFIKQNFSIEDVNEVCDELLESFSSSNVVNHDDDTVYSEIILLTIYYCQFNREVVKRYMSFVLNNLFLSYSHIKTSILDKLEKDNEFIESDLSNLVIFTPEEVYLGMKKWNFDDLDVRRVVLSCSLDYSFALTSYEMDDMEGFIKCIDLAAIDKLSIQFLLSSLKYIYPSLLENTDSLVNKRFIDLMTCIDNLYNTSPTYEATICLLKSFHNSNANYDITQTLFKTEEWILANENDLNNLICLFDKSISQYQLGSVQFLEKNRITDELRLLLYYKDQFGDVIHSANDDGLFFNLSDYYAFFEAFVNNIIQQIKSSKSNCKETYKEISYALNKFVEDNINFDVDKKEFFLENYFLKIVLFIASIKNDIDWLILAHLFYPSYPVQRIKKDKVLTHLEGGISWKKEPRNLEDCIERLNEAFCKVVSSLLPMNHSYNPSKITKAIAARALTCEWIINFANDYWPLQDNQDGKSKQDDRSYKFNPRKKLNEKYLKMLGKDDNN